MAPAAKTHGTAVFALPLLFHVTIAAKGVEHVLDRFCELRCGFMARITQVGTRIIDVVMVAIEAVDRAVIRVLKTHVQQGRVVNVARSGDRQTYQQCAQDYTYR